MNLNDNSRTLVHIKNKTRYKREKKRERERERERERREEKKREPGAEIRFQACRVSS